jgi:hypothetical protein
MEDLELLLKKRQYVPGYIPPNESILFEIEGKHIGSLQNFIILSGLPKTCKSTIVSAILGAAISKRPIFDLSVLLPEERKKIAYFDTESSDYDFYRQIQRIEKFANKKIPENILLYQVREDIPSSIKKMIEHLLKNDSEISFLIIDGLLDLCLNYNDERETRILVNWLKKITKQYNILILSVLHLGKKDEQTLGHLGSNTDRWAQSTLKITKDKEKGIYSLEPKFLRSADDFNPICIKNFNGEWQQVNATEKKEYNSPETLIHSEKIAIIHTAIKKPLSYNELVESIKAVTGRGTNYAKQLIRILLVDKLIEKTEKGYADKNFF